jgi:hypothetical protein
MHAGAQVAGASVACMAVQVVGCLNFEMWVERICCNCVVVGMVEMDCEWEREVGIWVMMVVMVV